MQQYRPILSLSISLLFFLAFSVDAWSQQSFPGQPGDKVRYTAYIEMPKAYISGVCVLVNDGNEVKGCLFNEFGISAIEFSYLLQKDKVKLHDVMPVMNKWYIKKVLKKDLRQLMHCLQQGVTQYKNERRRLSYTLTPITENKEESQETTE
jgi:hypothetical protein